MAYGDSTVAQKHALTTMENHFREDGTCVHLVDYADDGSVRGRQTVQGYADDTAWARGQAWALYGYARMAERRADWAEPEVHFQPFHNAAAKLEAWLLENLPEDGIPYWDFSQSDYKDASAGAIIACGLLKMHGLRGYPDDDPALAMAERILRTLASPEYLAEPRTNGGFLLKHSVGNLPSGSEVDVPLTYADYYFLEALTLFPN
ncbi:MAG: glycoside hydrolase family 88 protein, partial [Bacteroidales bacterium]|nr:glycoside hydrolase family 88 protein [Bacteroidales bacterium]